MIYNPMEQERFSVVSIYVNTPKVKVLSPSGKPVVIQLSAVWDGPTSISHEAYQARYKCVHVLIKHVNILYLEIVQKAACKLKKKLNSFTTAAT